MQGGFQKRCLGLVTAVFIGTLCAAADTAVPRLMRNPSLSAGQIAFLFADDIWTVARAGGVAHRVTHDGRARAGPLFSPDGRSIAYSAGSGPFADIFVVSAAGGEPRRISWYPDNESPIGWTADGRDVIFSSDRTSGVRKAPTLFRAAADGAGQPIALPVPTGTALSFSPDARRAAYVPGNSRKQWKGYRGGQAPYIWLLDFATLDVVKVPHTTGSDWNPMWIDDRVYFLSDRDGPVTLYAFEVPSGTVRRVLDNTGFDFMSASNGPGGVVIDAFDSIRIFSPDTGTMRRVSIRIGDELQTPARRSVELPGERAVAASLSPNGDRYAIEARGEIFVAPTAGGAARNLTRSPAVADRSPFWAPDGASVAYVSDASGEYRLVIRKPDGSGIARVMRLGTGRGLFSEFRWAPDGRHISYHDESTAIWVLDVATGKSSKVASDPYGVGLETGAWSPDGNWLAYTQRGPNNLGVAYLYSVASGVSTRITDGRTDVSNPAFDRGGRYLYFLAGAERAMAETGTMASNGRPAVSGLYAVLLSSTALPPEDPPPVPSPAFAVQTEGLSSRIVRLPAPERGYRDLLAADEGVVYLVEDPGGKPAESGPSDDGQTVWRMNWPRRRVEVVLTHVQGFELTASGAAAVVRRGGTSALVPVRDLPATIDGTPGVAAPGVATPRAEPGHPIKIPALGVTADPRAEWAQIYHEAWRFQRDLFYAAHYNGLDLADAEARYAPFVAGLGSRSDLTYLIREMTTNLRVSHLWVSDPPPGDPAFGLARPPASELKFAGLLGADYVLENDRYRISRVYRGDPWDSAAPAPLAQPGKAVVEGDYLISVNGQELHAADNIDRVMEGLAGQSVDLRVAAGPAAQNARLIKVTPVADEFALRHAAWVEAERRMTDRLSGGKLAYVYVINTGDEGYSEFNRQYLAQIDKAGLVIDERNNAGGPIADYIVNRLQRSRLVQVWPRFAELPVTFPTDYIDGPAAMIINEAAGSGGDILPYMFQKAKAGPLVGKRSWGGSIGGGDTPLLLDGGMMSVPHFPISDPDGTWGGLEGSGAVPDIEVDMDPKSAAAGRDPQLEAAVRAVMDQLAAHPRPAARPPPARNINPTP